MILVSFSSKSGVTGSVIGNLKLYLALMKLVEQVIVIVIKEDVELLWLCYW